MNTTRLLAGVVLFAMLALVARYQTGQAQRQKAATISAATARPRLITQLGHLYAVTSIAVSPDGRFVLTGSGDGTILWEKESGREIRRYSNNGVTGVAFSPDGRSILETGCDFRRDHGMVLMDLATGKQLWGQGGPIKTAVFSPNGQYVLAAGSCASTTEAGRVACLFDARTGQHIRCFKGHTAPVTSVAFSPDSRYVLTGASASLFQKENPDNTARLWDVSAEEPLLTLPHPGGVEAVAFSPDGRLLMTGGYANYEGATFSPDRRQVDQRARLWDRATGRLIRELDHQAPGPGAIAFSPDSQLVLTVIRRSQSFRESRCTLVLSRVATGEAVWRLDQPSSNLVEEAVAFSPDGQCILTANIGPKVFLREAATGRERQSFEGYSDGVNATAISPDGRYILTAVGNAAHLWEVASGQEIRRFAGHDAVVASVAFSPDGKFVITGSFDRTARIWEVATARMVHRLDHADTVFAVAFSPSGKLVLTGCWDHTARLWNAETGLQVGPPFVHGEAVYAVAYSPDDRYFMTGSGDSPWFQFSGGPKKDDLDNYARLWDTTTGREVRRFPHKFPVYAIAISPDGRRAVTGGEDGAKLWDIATGDEITFFPEITINSAAFSSDGQRVVTGNSERETVIWGVSSSLPVPEEIRRFKGSEGNRAVALSPDNRFVVTADTEGAAHLWDPVAGDELCRLVSFRDGTWAVVDAAGRFDTNNLEEMRGLHWIMPDDPLKPLPIEIFMREYYEPQLLPRELSARAPDGETFEPVRPLDQLNRVQPVIRDIRIERQKDAPEMVTVVVEVSKGVDRSRQGPKSETGVYDVRLFRDRQLVGQKPEVDDLRAVRAGAEGASEGDLRAWREQTRIQLDKAGTQTLRFERIRLPRRAGVKQVEFSAYAFNEDRVKSATLRKMFEIPPGLGPVKGRAYLVTMGVSAYENPFWNLPSPARDARLVQETLAAALKGTGEYEAVIVVPLISDYLDAAVREKSATKANLKAVLDMLAGRRERVLPETLRNIPNASMIMPARPEDLVLISVSGHGKREEKNGKFYLIPYDTGPARGINVPLTPELLRRFISSDELSDWLKPVDAGEIVLIADACHSAAAVKEKGFKPGPMGSRGLGQLAYDKGARVLAAAQPDAEAREGGRIKQGYLTRALIRDGLQARQADANRDGAITLGEWLRYAVERVPVIHQQEEDVAQRAQRTPGRRRAGPLSFMSNSAWSPDASLQRPALFDFSRRQQDVTLAR
jgi:WD40 repeat protein/uncharacterized caspase-like protein